MIASAAEVSAIGAAPLQGVAEGPPALAVSRVVRTFAGATALAGVSLSVDQGEIHALVGPNGAGKTTLLRVLTGLVAADEGTVSVLGLDPARSGREVHRRLGVVSSGSRSFYLRISGLENLVFFARLYGFRRRAAVARARELLDAVDLADAAKRPVSGYSTGMQRRLAIARALIGDPDVLLIDEATHDLDPHAATRVRSLVRDAGRRGAAVLWTTQRLEEIRGFAHRVTLLDRGRVVFSDTVPRLLLHADGDQYLVRLQVEKPPPVQLVVAGRPVATLTPSEADDEHYTLLLARDAVLGDALDALRRSGAQLLSCTEARPSAEAAFIALVDGGRT